MRADELQVFLEQARPVGGRTTSARQSCVVEFKNACPASWNARIINIGAKFWFQDPAGNIVDEQALSKITDITTGGSDHITSQEGCARIVLAACTVEIGGKTQVLQNQSQTDPQHCLLNIPLTVGPKREVSNKADEFPLELTETRR